jgi:hypothetical protein
MASEPRALSDLKYQYEMTMERRNNLTGQASSLMGFASIIETIVIALLVGIVSSSDVVSLLLKHPNIDSIIWLLLIGFIGYIVTLVLALFAFRERMWIMAPWMPPIDGSRYLAADVFIENDNNYKDIKRAYQLIRAIDDAQQVNAKKYDFLKFAYISLIVGIAVTTSVIMKILSHIL